MTWGGAIALAVAFTLGAAEARAQDDQDGGSVDAERPPATPEPPAPEAPAPEAPAPEAPAGDTGAPTQALDVQVNGYFDARGTVQRVKTDGLAPADDVPRLATFDEANVQLKLRWGDRGFALGDASFIFQRAGAYPGGDHDVPAYRPLAVLSELYGSYNFTSSAHLTLGRKRVVWGPGFVVNPTDLIDPPKDPTDPSLQRAGAWLARLEFPFERFTVTALGAGRVMEEWGGVPAALVEHRAGDPNDDGRAHFIAAARLYALVANTDLNVEYFFSNLYYDAFERKSRVGASFSRVFGNLEVHGEALAQRGSARLYVDPACVTDFAAAIACGADRVAARSRLDDGALAVRALAGARYQFADDSMFTTEYLFQSDGYDAGQWRAFLAGMALARDARAMGVSVPFGPAATASPTGTPQKFVFDPLRRHYLFLVYSKPRIHDDFTFTVTALATLHDLSGQVAPSLAWSVREWITLALWLFAPVPGVRSLAPEVGGARQTELGLAPADFRGVFSAKVFY